MNFIEPQLHRNGIDRYFIRYAIFNALKGALTSFNGKMLDIGCGKMPYKDYILANSGVEKYIGLDIETALVYDQAILPDFTWDGIKMPFESDSFDSAIATEVLEHCPEPSIVLKEVVRVLKPGGSFFFTVPFIWNLHEVPHDEFRYTPFALERILKDAGFTKIEIKPTGGWHATMAQMLGLWLIRSEMPLNLRRFLKVVCYPLYKLLLKFDRPINSYKEGTISPSYYGIAYLK